jgi:hypothetical protein
LGINLGIRAGEANFIDVLIAPVVLRMPELRGNTGKDEHFDYLDRQFISGKK